MINNDKVYGGFKVTVVLGVSLRLQIITFKVQIDDGSHGLKSQNWV